MHTLKSEKKLAVLSALLEGNSIRATSRMTGVHKTTIMRLLVETGEKCAVVMSERMRELPCAAIEADELWCYVGKKNRNLTPEEKLDPELGDQYTFIAFDPDTKLVPAWVTGKRNSMTTMAFLSQLKDRIPTRYQLSTDGMAYYATVVEMLYGRNGLDYAQIDKRFSNENPGFGRYSPPKISGIDIREISGRPVRDRICTSYVERNNLTVRMQIRRFTRLTNGFSRKLRNLKAALALFFAHYNFCRIHGSIRMTPAMAAGLSDHVWTLHELVVPA